MQNLCCRNLLYVKFPKIVAEKLAHLQKHGFDYPYILHTLYIKKGRSDTPLT